MSRKQRHVVILLVALAGLSVYQWVVDGEVSWHRNVTDQLPGWADREDAGWRQATDAINDSVPAAPTSFDIEGRVVRVADGDTVSVLDDDNQQFKIRFYGIDAPERGQPFGNAARRELSSLIEDRRVQVIVKDIDDYDRRVGEIFYRGESVNLHMVEQGYAWWYRYHARSRQDFEKAEYAARNAKRGLWSDREPIAPWDWRRQNRR